MRLIFFTFIIATTFVNARAWAGHESGNGGDLYSVEFVEIGHKVVDLLRNNGSQGLDLTLLEKTVGQTKVESTDQPLSLDGLPKDAINHPDQGRIVFNRQRWDALDAGEKPVLVLHEYLSLLGLEGANYQYSRTIIGTMRYDSTYSIDCNFQNGNGSLDLGIDESAGMDTILLSARAGDGKWIQGNTMRPVGEFSRMIRDGNFQLAFEGTEEGKNSYLVALRAGDQPLTMTGQFAANSQIFAVSCVVRKLDTSKF